MKTIWQKEHLKKMAVVEEREIIEDEGVARQHKKQGKVEEDIK
jgi:hypothetical protein